MSNKSNPLKRQASAVEMDRIGSVQMHGIMWKKPVGHKSATWSKRFFVLKEGFLFYYGEQERKAFAEKSTFSIHPKGMISLAYCSIEETAATGVNFAINIIYPDQSSTITLGVDDLDMRTKWIELMDIATRITAENLTLDERMIASLQKQNLQLAREKQEYLQKYIKTVDDFEDEREQREILEEINLQLEEEKEKIESIVNALQAAHEDIKKELNKTTEACITLENDRENMMEATERLKTKMKELNTERDIIMKRLLNYEANSINEEELATLREELERISGSAETLEQGKLELEEQLRENESKLLQLSNEKKNIATDFDELKEEIQELNHEKQNVETELKEEIAMRVELQHELIECKEALRRLELEVQYPLEDSLSQNSEMVEKQTQIRADVKSLKKFFDGIAVESQLESHCVDMSKRKYSRRFTQIKKMRLSPDVDNDASGKSLKVPSSGFINPMSGWALALCMVLLTALCKTS